MFDNSDFGDGLADVCFTCFACGRDVDVEALRADYFTGVVVEGFPMTTTSRVAPWMVMMRWRVLNGLWVRRMSSSVAATCS